MWAKEVQPSVSKTVYLFKIFDIWKCDASCYAFRALVMLCRLQLDGFRGFKKGLKGVPFTGALSDFVEQGELNV